MIRTWRDSIRCLRIATVGALLGACAVSGPFEGPGYDVVDSGFRFPYQSYFTESTTGEPVENRELLAVVTHLKVRGGGGRQYGRHEEAIDRQLDGQPGFVGRSLRRRIGGRQHWTLTVWTDEAAMVDFATSGAHLAAVAEASALIEGTYSTSYPIDPWAIPPSWEDALQQLRQAAPDDPWAR